MGFQLVRVEDTEIVVWHVEHGHIFLFQIIEDARALAPGPIREVPEASVPAVALRDEALAFATAEGRSRGLIE